MNKEAVMIVGLLVAGLSAAGIALTPEDKELLEVVIAAVLAVAGAFVARSQVASKDSVEREAPTAARKLFRRGR